MPAGSGRRADSDLGTPSGRFDFEIRSEQLEALTNTEQSEPALARPSHCITIDIETDAVVTHAEFDVIRCMGPADLYPRGLRVFDDVDEEFARRLEYGV